MRMRSAITLLCLLALAFGGCGDASEPSNARPKITVSAAASLTDAFTAIGRQFKGAKVFPQFAGSDALAAQIETGLRPAVFAAANTKLPAKLYAKGLVEKPVVFATNSLVVIVPKSSTRVRSILDLSTGGTKVAVAANSVPVGAYAQKAIAKLPTAEQAGINANIRSREADVKGVVGKVLTGAVDAGFVYRTDALAADDKVRVLTLPPLMQPEVAYAAAAVKGTKYPAIARQFVAELLSADSRKELAAAGFGLPAR